tara:strand:+ start:1652 stop:1801 length:150 start_codon:yes stop_codon:yes gene_type:complete
MTSSLSENGLASLESTGDTVMANEEVPSDNAEIVKMMNFDESRSFVILT